MNNDEKILALKALADPVRLSMLQKIYSEKEISCSRLLEDSHLSQPTLSHHLSKLYAARLITMRKEKTSHIYGINTAGFTKAGLQAKQLLSIK